MDSCLDREMKKLTNWLLWGMSSHDVHGDSMGDQYNDSFFVISKDSFQGYINTNGFKLLSKLSTLVSNCNLYTITKVDENDSERNEVCKVSRFYEFVHDKKSLGMPIRELKEPEKKKFGSDLELVERWPMIQAYGLDIVAGGFFSMKHNVKNLREELK
jgi:hypothetical protein